MLKVSLLKTVYEKGGLFFRIFQTYSWEQRKAKELCSIGTGKSNTQEQVDDGKYPFYIIAPDNMLIRRSVLTAAHHQHLPNRKRACFLQSVPEAL